MLERHLIEKINKGRCFIFIGSGPSCEVGYPSWHKLAEEVYAELKKIGKARDDGSYEKYLSQKKYPELFRQAEIDSGGRTELFKIVNRQFTLTTKKAGTVYDIIKKWPFACYLTTNFDDEIKYHLDQTGESFSVIRNRIEDFYVMRDGVSHVIQKLHSDLSHENEAILTSQDYSKLYTKPEGQYFRDKLRSIFEMFDFLIIGHSLSDPDINYILQLAKLTASPGHPIYFISSDFTEADINEYYEQYNIVVQNYKNLDGMHRQLHKILTVANKFIVPRESRIDIPSLDQVEIGESDAASSLFIFRTVRDTNDIQNLSALILLTLENIIEPGVDLSDVLQHPALKRFKIQGIAMRDIALSCLKQLSENGYVSVSLEKYWITDKGTEKVKEYKAIRENEKELAYAQFVLQLKKESPTIDKADENKCKNLAEKAIITTFRSRGLTIANRVFVEQKATAGELTDIFGYVAEISKGLEFELRASFIDAMYEFIVNPNAPQKKYLASLSQGYFLYHLLGLDPKCAKIRRQIVEETIWFVDSSVILPLIAVGCSNHEYSKSLFSTLKKMNAMLYTIPELMKEAWEHLWWAITFVKTHPTDSMQFLKVTAESTGHNINLFLDGYIRMSSDGIIRSFQDYLKIICPNGINQKSFYKRITDEGIILIEQTEFSGFVETDWGENETIRSRIKTEREQKNTYRSELQVSAEAAISVILSKLRTGQYQIPKLEKQPQDSFFISLSRIIDRVLMPAHILTWTPEALYRYMSVLPDSILDPELLQQCMLHEYYYAGVSFIDKARYLRYFGPSIDAAKTSFLAEKAKYIDDVGVLAFDRFEQEFERTPDLEKPFFVTQLGWKIAESLKMQEELSKRQALEAEQKAKQLESEREIAWAEKARRREEQEAARLRNLNNPKIMRKLERQKKKARRKNRK